VVQGLAQRHAHAARGADHAVEAGHGHHFDDGRHAAPFLAHHPGQGAAQFGFAGGVGGVAHLLFQALHLHRVLAAVRPPARQQEARESARRLRQHQEGVAHRRRDEELVAHQLVGLAGAFRAQRQGARGVGAHVRAALLFGHGHTDGEALLLLGRHIARVVDPRGDFRHPLRGEVGLQLQAGHGGEGHGDRAAVTSLDLRLHVELGGTDQKFNLLVGRDLQQSYNQEPQVVLTMPILEGLDGVNKMSKSLDNYISVVDTPKDMFGKTMRISDTLMYRYYELLTDMRPTELVQLKVDVESKKKHPRDVKVALAKFLVKRFHSETAAQTAEDEFNRIFADKGLPDEIPVVDVPAENQKGFCVLMVQLGLAQTNSEAARLIQGGGVQLNGEKLADSKLKLDLKSGNEHLIKAGKKKFVRIKIL